MKLRIELLMETKKPFKECDLNVAELAEILNTKPYILSKIINEHYKKNFRDFINDFRVQEFIKLAQSESYKNYTFLALAHEVGFNSKSTFNLAFKKTTQKSPREFLKDKKLNIKGL
jgi:AraC-like DNA-binding protein